MNEKNNNFIPKKKYSVIQLVVLLKMDLAKPLLKLIFQVIFISVKFLKNENSPENHS